MRYRQLGGSDLHISEIGFGCMSLGSGDNKNLSLIHAAIDAGINFFDTADLYDKGMNEAYLGSAIKGKRDGLVIASKVGNQWRTDGSGWDWNPRKEYILDAVEKSLQRLHTGHIDLYQLHGGTMDDPIDETIETFELLKQQGKIRHYGISSIRPNVISEYIARSSIVSVMMQYSLLDRRPEEACLGLLKQRHIGVLARGSLAQGLLVNKPAKAYLDLATEDVQRAVAAIGSVSGTKRSEAQTAIRYVLENDSVSSAVIGIRTDDQLAEVIKATTAPVLTAEEISLLKASVPPIKYKEHRV